MNRQYEVKALEHCTFKAVADPAELYSVLCIEHLWGKFPAFELQKAFHG